MFNGQEHPPPEEAGLKFKGYRWSEVNYNGCFFRAKGQHASTFNSGEQGDAIRNIRSNVFHMYGYKHPNYLKVSCEKPLFIEEDKPNYVPYVTNIELYSPGMYYLFKMMCDLSLCVPTTDYENRPRNQTIIIWRLEKI